MNINEVIANTALKISGANYGEYDKINPVILENTIQIAERAKGHDVIISNLAAAGNLELNAFLPLIPPIFEEFANAESCYY